MNLPEIIERLTDSLYESEDLGDDYEIAHYRAEKIVHACIRVFTYMQEQEQEQS